MKLTFAILLSVIAISSGSFAGEPVEVSTDAFSAVHDFEFKVEIQEKTVVFETVHGTKWKGLSWATGDESPMEFWLDECGISSQKEDLQGSKFLIHFLETAAGAKMVSSGGTSWPALGFGCGEAGPCRYVVSENGVTGQ